MINYEQIETIDQRYPNTWNVFDNQVAQEWRCRSNVLQIQKLSHERDIRLQKVHEGLWLDDFVTDGVARMKNKITSITKENIRLMNFFLVVHLIFCQTTSWTATNPFATTSCLLSYIMDYSYCMSGSSWVIVSHRAESVVSSWLFNSFRSISLVFLSLSCGTWINWPQPMKCSECRKDRNNGLKGSHLEPHY